MASAAGEAAVLICLSRDELGPGGLQAGPALVELLGHRRFTSRTIRGSAAMGIFA